VFEWSKTVSASDSADIGTGLFYTSVSVSSVYTHTHTHTHSYSKIRSLEVETIK